MLTPVYIFPAGMGDAVMALAVAENYYAHNGQPMHIGHKNVDLFENNPRIVCHPEYAFWSLTDRSQEEAHRIGFHLISLFYFNFRQVTSTYWISCGASDNLVAALCSQAGLNGHLRVSPNLILSEAERNLSGLANGKIVVISSGVVPYKSWDAKELQTVIDAFPDQTFVQIGMPSDPPLKNVEDLRGRFTLCQVAGILSGARLFLGPVGGMMHLARSVDCPSLILLPSFESFDWHYTEFDYISPSSRCPECEKWQSNPGSCTHSETCLNIDSAQVIARLRDILALPRRKLRPEFRDVEASPVMGLELYEKIVSALANSAEMELRSASGVLLAAKKIELDEREFLLKFSVNPADARNGVEIAFPRNFHWLIGGLSVQWEREDACRRVEVRSHGFLHYRSKRGEYIFPYRHRGRLSIPAPVDGCSVFSICFACIAWEHLFPGKKRLLSKPGMMRFAARLYYNLERFWDALQHDSLKNVFIRSWCALQRM